MPPRKKAAPKNQCKLVCCTVSDERVAEIQMDIDHWSPGRYAEENGYGPSCTCTLAAAKEPCILHGDDLPSR
jgi:hypothetical protein